MGKKASLKIDMGYDIDELDYFEQDFGNEDEEGDKFSTQKQQKSPKVVSMVTTKNKILEEFCSSSFCQNLPTAPDWYGKSLSLFDSFQWA